METRIAVSVSEAASLIGVSRSSIYPRLLSGEVPSVVVGKRRLVPIAALREWLDSQLAAQAEAR